MKILLDTCTFLWILSDAPELSNLARQSFQDPANQIFLSAVSTWEIALKYSLGRLPLKTGPEVYIPLQRKKHGIQALPLHEKTTLHLSRLPNHHRDPFDRMLVCQAIVHGLRLLTPDPLIVQYPVPILW
ncbi:MAG: type II toxin-antitoxin system VapC family toxin [Planctomycetes bacterium]|nr:type II toxin-antitoxin system VapC family toxin [Planctomycetota bacterium]